MPHGALTNGEQIDLAGLSAPGEIVLDKWGIPHIRAANKKDLFFLQGFNAARDRLWQIDLWRKRGLGLLAADFGPGFLMQDRAARLFLYRGDMAAEWAAYGSPDMEEICTAFTAGINAYVDLVEREPDRLPLEFHQLGNRPSRWAPEDVVRIRSHGLTRNALSEVLRANVVKRMGGDVTAAFAADSFRMPIEPARTPRLPEGLDLDAVPVDCLDVFKLATAPVTFTPERLAARLDQAGEWTKLNDLGDVMRAAASEGSNNWAVHPSRTATGRPIMASDPHRVYTMPSIRYLVHLSAPGIEIMGAGEPCVPGIVIGHNERLAFGVTIFGADQEDVYVYETQPGRPNAYRYGEGWEAMRQVEERFQVKGEPDQRLTLSFTRHGPVLHEDRDRRTAVALRSVWFAPGSSAYLASVAGMRAGSIEEYRAAMNSWGAPSINQVVAEAADGGSPGRVAWMPVGFTPVRGNWDGLLPVPGDGRYEWQGFLDPELMPLTIDPDRGFVGTANEMNLPPDWSHDERPIGFEWVDKFRATRIFETLGSGKPQTLQDSAGLQTDTLSIPGRRLAVLLEPLHGKQPSEALDLLIGWDHRLEIDSPAAALFELWWMRHLKPSLLAHLVPDEQVRALIVPIENAPVLSYLEQPDGRMTPAERDQLLLATLEAAFADAKERLGHDVSDWGWGKLHHQLFEHPLTALGSAADRLDVGPFPRGGSGSTTMFAAYRPQDFRVTHGASVRLVMDVGGWDSSLCINTPGQSGDPRSPFYGNLAATWAELGYVPMLFSREAVDAATVAAIRLQPAG